MNLLPQIRTYGLKHLSPSCVDSLLSLNYHDVECFKWAFSKLLGVAIISGSVLIKIPQIYLIYKSKSSAGISLASYLLEFFGYLITLVYNTSKGFPFSTWGEYTFLAFQDLIIILLIYYYASRHLEGIILVALCVVGVYLFVSDIISSKLILLAQASTIPIFLLSKLPQLWVNYRNGHTGLLSPTTLALNAAGSWARVFTTLQEVKDPLILSGFLIGSILNSSLLFQIIFYYKKTQTVIKNISDKNPNSSKGKRTSQKKLSSQNLGGVSNPKPLKKAGK